MAISLEDIDAELQRRQAAAMPDLSGQASAPSLEDIDAELVRRGATRQESTISKVGNYIQDKAINFATDVASPKLAVNKMAENLPAIGAVAGGAMLPGAGAPLGAGLGQIVKRGVGIATEAQPPAGTPWQEAQAPIAQAVVGGLPETSEVKGLIQSGAQAMARRALGFGKRAIKVAGIDKANQVGQKMLDEGVIQPFSGTKETLSRAEDLADESGGKIGNLMTGIDQSGNKYFNNSKLVQEISSQLRPERTGGLYDTHQKIVDEVLDTVRAHGDGPISFENAQQLKKTLADAAKFNSISDATKAQAYRRASGIISDAMENAVEGATEGTPAAADYLKNKETYGAASMAKKALEDRLAGEGANNIVSLRGAAAGAFGLGTGNIAKTLEGIGGWELLRRYGEGTGASVLNAMNKSPGFNAARQAALATFIDKITTKQNAH